MSCIEATAVDAPAAAPGLASAPAPGSKEDSMGWTGGWTAKAPPQLEYRFSAASDADWGPGPRDYMEYRELGLKEASGDRIAAWGVRRTGTGQAHSGWHFHDLDFQLFFVTRGQIRFETERGDNLVLGAGGIGYAPPFWRHNEELSEDCEVVEFTVPAAVRTVTGLEAPLPARAGQVEGAGPAFYANDAESLWTDGDERRPFLASRETRAAENTGGRLAVQMLKANGSAPSEGTGWHDHAGAQFVIVLGGSVDLEVDGHERRRMTAGDAMAIPAGARHNATAISDDYKAIELTLPAA
jgi:quercetin dioxygenase-like cupin family protein